jgi:Cu2+-exporting ATPase
MLGGHRYRLGRPAWVGQTCAASIPAELRADASVVTLVVLADETHWIACLRFGDSLREGAQALIDALRNDGRRISMLSGDRRPAVYNVARMLDIADWRADATPDDKRAFIANLQRRGEVVAMIGDGLNDAPGLARADVSIAFGRTAALTQWTADTVVLGDDLARVAHALREARRAFRVIRQNLSWALAYNVVAIPLAVSGHLSPLAAAIGMSASSLIVVGNAWRLSRPATRSAGVGAPHRAWPIGMPVAGLLR